MSRRSATAAIVVRAEIDRFEEVDLILGIKLIHTRNTGVAFSLFSGGGPLVVIIACVALAALLIFFITHLKTRLIWLPVGMLLGGIGFGRSSGLTGWRRWLPLALGVYVFVPLFPAVFAPFAEIGPTEYERVTKVTYLGFVNGTRAALARMLPRDRGTIVQVGSALGERAIPLQSAYCGAKHAINGFSSSLRLELLHRGDENRPGMAREAASSALDRYGLVGQAQQSFETLSGGQQARFQILLLELSGTTLLLLDEPTDNLDLASAEALEAGLEAFEGTVVAVTHDRWFARGLDRFLVFDGAGAVTASDEPVWDVARAAR